MYDNHHLRIISYSFMIKLGAPANLPCPTYYSIKIIILSIQCTRCYIASTQQKESVQPNLFLAIAQVRHLHDRVENIST